MTKQERLLKEQKVNNVNITLKPALYFYEWEEEVAKNFGLTKFEADDKKLLLKKYYNNYLDTNNNRYYLRLREVQD
ncbi:MAG: hypothetical protein LBM13_02285, partial [Candidatus Ancillula sp.]|nr:hypothetical protein [Candidatus Ancillula sp.]